MSACIGLGKLVMGAVADRLGSRRTLIGIYSGLALVLIVMLYATNEFLITPAVLLVGIACGGPLTVGPMLLAEQLGLKRFGSISSLASVFYLIGAATSRLVMGAVFDHTSSYLDALLIYIPFCIMSALAIYSCGPVTW